MSPLSLSLPSTLFLLSILLRSIICAPLPTNGFSISGGFGGLTEDKRASILAPDNEKRQLGIAGAPCFGFNCEGLKEDKRDPGFIVGDPDFQFGVTEEKEKRQLGIAGAPCFGFNCEGLKEDKRDPGFIVGDPDRGFGLTEEKEKRQLGIAGAPCFGFNCEGLKEDKRSPSPIPDLIGIVGTPDFEFGLTEEKRSASPAPQLDFTIGGDPVGLTRGSKRSPSPAPSPAASPDDVGIVGVPYFEFGLTEEKRGNDVSVAGLGLDKRGNNIGIVGSPDFEFGLTRGSKA